MACLASSVVRSTGTCWWQSRRNYTSFLSQSAHHLPGGSWTPFPFSPANQAKTTLQNKVTFRCFSSRHFPVCCYRCGINRDSLLSGKITFSKDAFRNRGHVIRWTTTGNSAKKTKIVPRASEIKRLLSIAKPEKWKIAAAVGLLLISSSVSMVVPFGIGKVIDIIYTNSGEGNVTDRLKDIYAVLIGIFLLGGAANFGRVYLMRTSGQRIIKRLREQLYASIVNQEVAFFDRTKTGELVNRLSTDSSVVGQAVTMNVSDGIRSSAQAGIGLGMMFYVSPKLTIVALSVVPPVFIVAIAYGRYIRRISKKVQDSLADSTQVAEERLANLRTIRAFAQEPRELERYKVKITDVLNLSYKEALATGVFFGFTGLSGNIMIMSLIYYGGSMIGDAQITVGDLTSFLFYAVYIGVSMTGMTNFYSEMMRGLGASTRMWELVDRVPAIPFDKGLIPTAELLGRISFQDVHFSYPTRPDNPIFQGLSLEVPQGSVLAVVGASGSGKSSLASLLLRYYDPDKGSILVDGYKTQEVAPAWLRRNMGVVSQEPVLFSSSIRENIAYGATDPATVREDQIVEAAKKANAHSFIQSFDHKFDTLVGERGIMLSGGQKQRIAIARAIIKNPKILLLDEATSALDAESEFLVQEALERIMVGRTVITIAHRLSTIKNADRIAVLDKGVVAEFGNYNQLMAFDDGLFRKLVERQTITNQ